MIFKELLIFVTITTAVTCARRTFRGDQVLTLFPTTDDHVTLIQGFGDEETLVDFWSPGYASAVKRGIEVDVRVPSVHLNYFKGLVNQYGMEYKVKISDVQRLIDGQHKTQAKALSSGFSSIVDYDYNVYHQLEEINDWTVGIANAYGGIVRRSILGQSTEGRDIPMLTVETDPSNPALFLDCGFHAREWISPAFCQCFTKNLLENYGQDPYFTNLLDQLTFYIVPVVNVDGYKYSWETDRMWRKTRSYYAGDRCIGTDPNRNCDALWSGPGSSNISCAATYYGPYVESEPEVKALANFIRGNIGKIMTYVTVHSYGQMIIYPYSYTTALAEDDATLNQYATKSAEAIESVSGTKYIYGAGATLLYEAAGGSDDFAYDAGVPISYTYELRDTGKYGFILPDNQIEGTCVETTAGMKVFADAALEMRYNN